ncbi:MAG: PssD/Cps14F family polysaccharide biosynthesis glycosyltransferase [Methanobacteriota archaeon]
MKGKKICLISSGGGHFTEMQPLIGEFKECNPFFVTAKEVDTEDMADYYLTSFHRKDNKKGINIRRLIKNIIESLRILHMERPDYVISTGAIVCVPFMFLSKLFGSKLIYIESAARVSSKSNTGRLVYPISDYFFVQWEPLLRVYGKKAKYSGNLI